MLSLKLLKFIKANKKYFNRDFYKTTKIKLLDANKIVTSYHNYVEVPQYAIDTIIKYIGDENDIYPNVDKCFFDLVKSSKKLMKNVNDFVLKHFEPNIYQKYKDVFKHRNVIKDIVLTKKISYNHASDLDLFYATIYGFALVDIYLLGRLFKKFIPRDTGIHSTSTNNIIIIAGQLHINEYVDFLTKIGSKIIHEPTKIPNISMIAKNPSKRCVPFHDITF